jgi:hypothetical protein
MEGVYVFNLIYRYGTPTKIFSEFSPDKHVFFFVFVTICIFAVFFNRFQSYFPYTSHAFFSNIICLSYSSESQEYGSAAQRIERPLQSDFMII